MLTVISRRIGSEIARSISKVVLHALVARFGAERHGTTSIKPEVHVAFRFDPEDKQAMADIENVLHAPIESVLFDWLDITK